MEKKSVSYKLLTIYNCQIDWNTFLLTTEEFRILGEMRKHDLEKLRQDELNYDTLTPSQRFKFEKTYHWMHKVPFEKRNY